MATEHTAGPTATLGPDGDGQWVRTADVRALLSAMQSLCDGDFSVRAGSGYEGVLGELAGLFDQLVARNAHHASELQRVHRELVREGRLDERLEPSPGRGAWATSVDTANGIVEALVVPSVNATRVLEAVADGDLTQRAELHDGKRKLRGDRRLLGQALNRMVDDLSHFTGEVTGVAREVGTDGHLGGQAEVAGLSGDWRRVTEAVNAMAARLTAQVRDISGVTTAVARGDLTRQVTVEASGELLELKLTVNTMVDQLRGFADEVTRVAREVGTEGQLGGRAQVPGVSGVWKDLTESVNFMAGNLTAQVRNISQVTTAVADGDLSKKITVDARGEVLQLKDTVNTMVDQLGAFADEVTRVAHEVGTEGILGGQARVRGVSGVWKELTENVNYMARNLTAQVRNISQVATAVADGDLSMKIDVDARGEILAVKTTINTMVDTLSSFASEVTRVAREVGSEGQLGGQARVEGVHGTWKQLTTGVNELASNLTTQVRAIAEVADAVTQGDLSRSITVEARGEVAELKNNVNVMVSNLRETTRAKDWLESNLTRMAALMQGHRNLVEVADLILSELTPLVNAQFGAFFLAARGPDGGVRPDEGLTFIAGYGTKGVGEGDESGPLLAPGTDALGLTAQAAREKKAIVVPDVPPDYVPINSGLGAARPASIVILPILFEDRVLGVIELASLSRFNEIHLDFLNKFADTIGISLNTILANARTEELLSESQRLTVELRERSDELQRSNAALEEKAALLATASQYKSEFLANMSHELRTPLNSLLILAQLLIDNPDGHLSEQEVQFATTIHRSGSDLLQLINDVLDLSKVEAGRMDVRPRELPLEKLIGYVHGTFDPMAADRGLEFGTVVGDDVPRELYSDEQRLQQILRNLLSNALKFTPSGSVELRVERVPAAGFDEEALRNADDVIAFSVSDTGIGIPAEKLPLVFEAFRQSEGSTNRSYAGTGLGLSISREIAGLLGGRIAAESEPGVGSRFTLYIPAHHPTGHTPPPAEPVTAPGATQAPPAPVNAPAPPPVPTPPPATPAPAPAPVPTPDKALPEKAVPREVVADKAVAEDVTVDAVQPPPAEPASRDGGWPETTRLRHWLSGRSGRVLKGRRILIVDDDIRNVFALTQVLGRVGITVKYAENGREGLELLQRNPDVSLILMDIMMPEMDGYAAISAIRRTPRLAHLPVIALTAKAMPQDRDKAMESGASSYVTKPVDVDTLLSVICELLDPSGADDGDGQARRGTA